MNNQAKSKLLLSEVEESLITDYFSLFVILSDHIKSLDWKIRKAEYCDELEDEILNEVLAKILPLIN